jgi:hypothetical protein
MIKSRGYSKAKTGKVGNPNNTRSNTAKSVNKSKKKLIISNKSNINQIGGNSKQLSMSSTSNPVSYSTKVSVKKPRLGGSGSLNVKHAELLTTVETDVKYEGGFNVLQASMNPGLQRVFPWLSNIARNFQEYRFRSIRIIYISECPTSFNGNIMLSASYDPSLSAPSNETDFSNYEGMVEDNVYKCLSFDLNKAGINSQLHYYVRGTNPNTNISNEDIKLLDCANIYVAYSNVNGGNLGVSSVFLGKLWVEYDVDLLRPFSNQGLQQVILTNSWQYVGAKTSLTVLASAGTGTTFDGTSTLSDFVKNTSGKFISGNWDMYQGTNLWIALKGIGTKLIRTTLTGGTVTTGLTILLYQYAPTKNDDGNVGFTSNISDIQELMQLADTSVSSFTALTTSANIVTGTAIANTGATLGSVSYAINLPLSCVIQVVGTGNAVSTTACFIEVTDFDFSSLNSNFQ